MKRIGKILCGVLVVVLVAGWWAHWPRPALKPGADADRLARQIMSAVNAEAWNELDRVVFSFFGQKYDWRVQDKQVYIGDGDDRNVLNLGDETCEAVAGNPGPDEGACASLFARWYNDSFWLNPFGKFFDPGAKRSTCLEKETPGPWLCVEFGAGGKTPGDLYAIQSGPDGRPMAWRMWVGILPIGGIHTAWSGWEEQTGGAWFAKERRGFGLTLPIKMLEIEAPHRP